MRKKKLDPVEEVAAAPRTYLWDCLPCARRGKPVRATKIVTRKSGVSEGRCGKCAKVRT